jgi:predicted Fe-S protein YdhL (DUF1289 family)
MDQPENVPSPCTEVCIVDRARGLCIGCWRTLDEIAAWRDLTPEQKRQVLKRVEQRRPRQPPQAP